MSDSIKWKSVKKLLLQAAEETAINHASGLGSKYVTNPEVYIDKQKKMYDLIAPASDSKVFEIGPGVGYFGYICEAMNDNILFEYHGIDCMIDSHNQRWKEDCCYYEMHKKLGLNEKIREFFISPQEKIEFGLVFDYIVAMQASFAANWKTNQTWELNDHIFFLQDCLEHLSEHGSLFIQHNVNCLTDEIKSLYQGLSDKETISSGGFKETIFFYITRKRLKEYLENLGVIQIRYVLPSDMQAPISTEGGDEVKPPLVERIQSRFGIDFSVFKEAITWKGFLIGIVMFSVIGYSGLSII